MPEKLIKEAVQSVKISAAGGRLCIRPDLLDSTLLKQYSDKYPNLQAILDGRRVSPASLGLADPNYELAYKRGAKLLADAMAQYNINYRGFCKYNTLKQRYHKGGFIETPLGSYYNNDTSSKIKDQIVAHKILIDPERGDSIYTSTRPIFTLRPQNGSVVQEAQLPEYGSSHEAALIAGLLKKSTSHIYQPDPNTKDIRVRVYDDGISGLGFLAQAHADRGDVRSSDALRGIELIMDNQAETLAVAARRHVLMQLVKDSYLYKHTIIVYDRGAWEAGRGASVKETLEDPLAYLG